MPLGSSPASTGYIYDATPDPDGGLLAAASVIFSHQGHQVVHDPCLDLKEYCQALSMTLTIILVIHLPNHILLSGLELMEGLFPPSPADVLGKSIMLAYLSSPAPHDSASMGGLLGLAPATGSQAAQSLEYIIPTSSFMRGRRVVRPPLGDVILAYPLTGALGGGIGPVPFLDTSTPWFPHPIHPPVISSPLVHL
jgi:hypothetical protein